jgi:hypothetical protein
LVYHFVQLKNFIVQKAKENNEKTEKRGGGEWLNEARGN